MASIRQRTQAVPVAGGRVLCRSLGRYKLFVDDNDVGFGSHLMLDGFWEFGITEFIARNVRRGATVLDLGANVGYYTLLMAELVGAEGRVIAFEPHPNSARNLADNISINGFSSRVEVRREAIWRYTAETLYFLSPENEPKNAAIVTAERAEAATATEIVSAVRTFAVDDLFENVAFAKVDIEGAEEEFWRGSKHFFERNKDITVLLEFNSARCWNPAQTLKDISEMYSLRVLDDDSNVVPIEAERILQTPTDWMLVLSHRASHDL